jgi:hypothetical protein
MFWYEEGEAEAWLIMFPPRPLLRSSEFRKEKSMARLEGVAVGLYFPTPEPVITAIAPHLSLPSRALGSIRLLDPCAGTGRAVALLAQTLNQQSSPPSPKLEVYGIEPNLQRARAASGLLGEQRVLTTSYFTASLSEKSFQVAYVNPPYDQETEGDGRKERLEVRFLRRATLHLAPGGILIWVVPQRLLAEGASHLAGAYRQLSGFRFPDDPWAPPDADRDPAPMYATFKQVVLIGIKRAVAVPPEQAVINQLTAWAEAGEALQPLPAPGTTEEESEPRYTPPLAEKPLGLFAAAVFDPDATARQVNLPGIGLWGQATYLEQHWPDPAAVAGMNLRPLMPLRRGHLGLLAAAGLANGAVLENQEGRRLLVKGSCRKVILRETTQTARREGETVEEETLTDTFKMALWAFDLDTGELLKIE